eukprot:3556735-Rhodomonas_salina.1
MQFQPSYFSGTAGPTLVGEEAPTHFMQALLDASKGTPLFYFCKFFYDSMINQVVDGINDYIEKLATMAQPPPGYILLQHMQWPPTWVESWVPMTRNQLWRWLAMLMWMGLQKKASESELWSSDALLNRPVLLELFFTWNEHQIIKAALHCQEDDEHEIVMANQCSER